MFNMKTTALGVASRRTGIGLIGIIVALVFLAGCAGLETMGAPNAPLNPNIHWMRDSNQMTCITPQDTVLLFKYMQYMEMKARDNKMPKDNGGK